MLIFLRLPDRTIQVLGSSSLRVERGARSRLHCRAHFLLRGKYRLCLQKKAQSKELTRGPPELVQHFHL